jgi:hypothetical protein
MRIPYGKSSFSDIRRSGSFYADKTPFLPELESAEAGYSYLIFLRPRRFGKSTLLSMLAHYYDMVRADHFDELFRGLWIHEHPTPERGQYLVLSLDFSAVNTSSGPEALYRSFFGAVRNGVTELLLRYRARVPELSRLDEQLSTYQDPDTLIGALLAIVGGLGYKLYLLIDEYDHFASRILADGDQDFYESIVRGTGFVRNFYAALKAGTSSGALGRMFVTGVSPIMLDDLSSGFNIITHISQHPRFNALAGFTRADVERATDEFLLRKPELAADPRIADRAALRETLERYYDGYRFSAEAAERVYNSDLVLYFFRQIENTGRYPEQMLDMNARTDYGRLQRIARLSGAEGAEARALLEAILTEEHVSSPLVEQFGARSMHRRAQLVSLFYYMGMLTFGPGSESSADPLLVIPNLVIRELQWEYLALALHDQENIWIDTQHLSKALGAMAVQGDIQPLLTLFREEVVARIGTKDLRQFNEKVLKLMLLAYISQSRTFKILSEKEFSGGYCDLFLGLTGDVPAARFAWMLEVKYLRTHAKPADIERAFGEALAQLDRYASDRALVPLLTLGKELRAGALVFVGARDVLFRPWPRVAPPEEKGGTGAPVRRKPAPGAGVKRGAKAAPKKSAKAAPKKAAKSIAEKKAGERVARRARRA